MERSFRETDFVCGRQGNAALKREKNLLRSSMKALRDSLSEDYRRQASALCRSVLKATDIYRKSRLVYSYCSFAGETDTQQLIREMLAEGKRVAVPKVTGKEMAFYEIRSLDECQPGVWGILEPVLDRIHDRHPVKTPGLMLVPGLAFDVKGNRLGYGGGYYDRYLQGQKGYKLFALAYKEQVLDTVPALEHDHRMDAVICDRLISINTGGKVWD